MAGGGKRYPKRAMPYLLKMGKSVKHLGGKREKGIMGNELSSNYFFVHYLSGLAETVLLSEKLGN